MGSMFQSDPMALCQLFIQPETAYNLVAALGEAGIVEFHDLNPDVHIFERKFISELRRCDEIERQLRYIETEIKRERIPIAELDVSQYPLAPKPRDIISLETQFEKIESEIIELSINSVNLKENYLELIELKEFLEKSKNFFTDNDVVVESIKGNLLTEDQDVAHCSLDFVAGTVHRSRLHALETMLWRISRGSIFMRHTELENSLSNSTPKYVFVAFFLGTIKTLLQKVCTGFRATLFPCPIDSDERNDMLKGVSTRLEDMKKVLNRSQDHRHQSLLNVARELPSWLVMISKMKAVYYTLNLFSVSTSENCLIGECWVPSNDLAVLHTIFSEESVASGSSIKSFLNVIQPEGKVPPTLIRTNRFTSGFQNLIDAYGISSYREVNPALYTIITFPFLFAVMFGDMGHGLILTLFALWMVIWEKSLIAKNIRDEIWCIFFGGRYIILLMGIFSVYTGFIYNDIFSKSMNIFGSSWQINYNTSTVLENPQLELNPSTDDLRSNYVYPIGLDPAWQLATNKIKFLNSYKLKLSIIFGVAHMIFGVAMSVVNMVQFKRSVNIFLEFLPQMIFLLLLFAYMTFMMFFKWVSYGGKMTEQQFSPGCAPSVLILFINMMLAKPAKPLDGCKEFMFESQNVVQIVCFTISVLCIPWMLLGKPIYVLIQRRKHALQSLSGHINHGSDLNTSKDEQSDVANSINERHSTAGGHGHEDEPMNEVFILSAIHAIEYCFTYCILSSIVGFVFGTCSVLAMGFMFNEYYGAIFIYIIFSVWAFFTLVILVMMEGLSAFLHTLRLHWVEFMSKFYEGGGYKFQPFSFKVIIYNDDNPE